MKTIIAKAMLALIATLTILGLQTSVAQAPPDPVGENFFPPELLQKFGEEIALSSTQQEWLRKKIEEVTARAPELQERLRLETDALAAVIKTDRIDEAKLLAQLDKVLDAERALKRLHLTTLAAIKNQLTSEQQARLRALRSQFAAEAGLTASQQAELKARLEGKIKRIQAAVQQWQESGQDPSVIGKIMQEFEPLMKQGKHKEAEAVLDRALAELGVSETSK